MGAQSARQWGCQAPLLLSESSSHASPKAGIQSNRRLLSGASWLCNAISRERRSCRRCAPWPVSALPAGLGTHRARGWSCLPGAAEHGPRGRQRGWPRRGAGAVSQHPVSQTGGNSGENSCIFLFLLGRTRCHCQSCLPSQCQSHPQSHHFRPVLWFAFKTNLISWLLWDFLK